MHLFRTQPLVEQLAVGAIGSEERAKYLLGSFLLFNLVYYSGFAVSTASPWTLVSVLEGLLMMGINVLGIVKTFDASGGKANPDFVAEFTCLYVPVSITTVLAVWGTYWALSMGFREGLIALSQSHFQFAMNLSSIGTDFLGFLTFAANVGVLAITYLRLTNLLLQVRRVKSDA